MTAGRPTDYTDETLPKTLEYISKCEDEVYVFQKMSGKTDGFEEKVRTHLPSIAGLSLHLGVSRETIYHWESLTNEDGSRKYPEFSDTLTRIRALQEQMLIDGGLSNRYNPVISKLILSSNHGYREGKDVTSDGKAIKGNTIVMSDFTDEADS